MARWRALAEPGTTRYRWPMVDASAGETPSPEAGDMDAGTIEVPASLRLWFVVHAAVDVAAAVPLLLAPEAILPRLGWAAVDPVSTRLVGAALAGIGVASWRARHASAAVVRALVGLKLVWSACAILGLAVAIALGAPSAAFALLSIFLVFCGVWSHHAIRFRQLARASAPVGADEAEPAGGGHEPPGLPE